MDRNGVARADFPALVWSLSARRAWIEIVRSGGPGLAVPVALRKESVDRNILSQQRIE